MWERDGGVQCLPGGGGFGGQRDGLEIELSCMVRSCEQQ